MGDGNEAGLNLGIMFRRENASIYEEKPVMHSTSWIAVR